EAMTMRPAKTLRPPYRSAQIPSRRRESDPVRMGVPTSSPSSVSESPNSSLIAIPMIEKTVQTAKQAVKAAVLTQSAAAAPERGACSVTAAAPRGIGRHQLEGGRPAMWPPIPLDQPTCYTPGQLWFHDSEMAFSPLNGAPARTNSTAVSARRSARLHSRSRPEQERAVRREKQQECAAPRRAGR